MIKLKTMLILLFLFLLIHPAFALDKAIILEVNHAIGPATQDYLVRGINDANRQQKAGVIIELNTPGGLESSMRGITAAILSSSIPVIAYVYPSGARAASAGLFILYASQLSAMAEGTNIGAATPVNLAGESEKNQATVKDSKAINDASAYIKSLAELNHRNITFAVEAVRKARSLSATEALKENVINVIANNYDELLQKAEGQKITLNNQSQILHTQNWQLERQAPDWRTQFLSWITNPNIAYLLMLLAFYGIFFEIYQPGMILPGVIGAISLLIVLYAFQLLPINYAGLLLIILGIGFIILELFVTSFIMGIGGVIAFIIGSIMLFDIEGPYFQLSWSLVFFMSVTTLIFLFLMLTLVIKAHRKKSITGKEGLLHHEGIVTNIQDNGYTVTVLGELWHAKSSKTLQIGDKIRVTAVNGLLLTVEPVPHIK